MVKVVFGGVNGKITTDYYPTGDNEQLAVIFLQAYSQKIRQDKQVELCVKKTLDQLGISSIFFEFEDKTNSFNKINALIDSGTVINWFQANNHRSLGYVIMGYGYSSWVAMQLLMRRPEISNFVLLSPVMKGFNFSFLAPCPAPGLISYLEEDPHLSQADGQAFVSKLIKNEPNIEHNIINGDSYHAPQIQNLHTLLKAHFIKIKNQIVISHE